MTLSHCLKDKNFISNQQAVIDPYKGEDYLTREINMKTWKLFFITFLLSGISLSAHSQQSSVPSHCAANETVFLTAKMKRINRSPQGTTFTDTGKIVSLCANQAKDPIGKLTYRYGPIGKVEMEHVASPSNKLGNASIQSAPRVSEDLYFFPKVTLPTTSLLLAEWAVEWVSSCLTAIRE